MAWKNNGIQLLPSCTRALERESSSIDGMVNPFGMMCHNLFIPHCEYSRRPLIEARMRFILLIVPLVSEGKEGREGSNMN